VLLLVLRTIIWGPTLLASFMVVAVTTNGRAADYSLAYGIELNGMRDTGTLDQCDFRELCKIRNARLDLQITVMVDRIASRDAYIFIHGYRGTCCLFGDGDNQKYLADIRPALIRVSIYEGKRRLGNEFVQSKPVGTLWLSFSKFWRPKKDPWEGPF
jgi:hypothetical protein